MIFFRSKCNHDNGDGRFLTEFNVSIMVNSITKYWKNFNIWHLGNVGI